MIMIWFGSEIDSNPPVSVDLAYKLIDGYEVKVLVCFVDLEIARSNFLWVRKFNSCFWTTVSCVEVIDLLGFTYSRIHPSSIYIYVNMCVPLFLNWKHRLFDLSILICLVFSMCCWKPLDGFKTFLEMLVLWLALADSLGVWLLNVDDFRVPVLEFPLLLSLPIVCIISNIYEFPEIVIYTTGFDWSCFNFLHLDTVFVI